MNTGDQDDKRNRKFTKKNTQKEIMNTRDTSDYYKTGSVVTMKQQRQTSKELYKTRGGS